MSPKTGNIKSKTANCQSKDLKESFLMSTARSKRAKNVKQSDEIVNTSNSLLFFGIISENSSNSAASLLILNSFIVSNYKLSLWLKSLITKLLPNIYRLGEGRELELRLPALSPKLNKDIKS